MAKIKSTTTATHAAAAPATLGEVTLNHGDWRFVKPGEVIAGVAHDPRSLEKPNTDFLASLESQGQQMPVNGFWHDEDGKRVFIVIDGTKRANGLTKLGKGIRASVLDAVSIGEKGLALFAALANVRENEGDFARAARATHLKDGLGMSVTDIAKALGIGATMVKALLRIGKVAPMLPPDFVKAVRLGAIADTQMREMVLKSDNGGKPDAETFPINRFQQLAEKKLAVAAAPKGEAVKTSAALDNGKVPVGAWGRVFSKPASDVVNPEEWNLCGVLCSLMSGEVPAFKAEATFKAKGFPELARAFKEARQGVKAFHIVNDEEIPTKAKSEVAE